MEDFIKDIYKYSKLHTELCDGIREARSLRMGLACDFFNESYKGLCECSKRSLEMGCSFATDFAKSIIDMENFNGDLRLLCDHIERKVLPYISMWIKELADIDVDTEDGYRLKSSDSGYITAQIVSSGRYIHSTYNPMSEAYTYIKNVFSPMYQEYIFFGCGMGYYVYQLYRISSGSIKITIYEKDINLVNYAKLYGVLDWTPDTIMNVVLTDDYSDFLAHSTKEDVRPVFHIPEIYQLDNNDRKEIEDLCIGLNTSNYMKDIAVMNYYRNLEVDMPDVTVLKERVFSDAIIVAAGPSVDQGIDYLRQSKGKKTIIAVNTIFRKLIECGIEPDYVVALDGSSRMEKHLIGLEKVKVPLIADLCVYWRWCRDYEGPKYRVYSTYTCREAERYIKENGKEKWPSGGTVTFLAMEFAYRMGAKRIYLLGVDMGYPDRRSHAIGTAYGMIQDSEELIEVCSVGGGKVLTDPVMNRYRTAMESRINQIGKEIEFYNLSTIGARINGTKEIPINS